MNTSSYLKKIKYNPTSSYSIPINLQIEILLRVKDKVLLSNSDCQHGLCNLIVKDIIYPLWYKSKEFKDLIPYDHDTDIAKSIICVFNKENAINFGNGRDELYWWPIHRKLTPSEKTHKYGSNLKKCLEVSTTYNIEPRIKFLDWCIETLKDYESSKKV